MSDGRMNDAPQTILLIEDDPDDAEFVMAIIRIHEPDANIVHLGDGEAALQFLYGKESEYPALILLDLRMPKVDGIQVLQRLKNDPAKDGIPVIVLVSSLEAGKAYVESFDLKPNGYLAKPVGINQFLKAIADAGVNWP